LADRVNLLGVLEDDPNLLATIKAGDTIKVQLLGRVGWE
jgi:hypothetical protein